MRIWRSISVAKNEGGMTMIELSMAAVIILGAVITMMAMFDTAIDILRYTTSRSLATQIGNQALEDIRSLDYAQAVVSNPTSWPVDADLDTSFVPPKFKDINESSATVWRSLITTGTAAGLQVEETIVRQRITFIIRKYVMYVDDGSDTDAFKRLVVKVKWVKTPVEGEVVMTSNFSRVDEGESRPLAKILGIRSTNYDYFANELIESTMGIDGAVRGPLPLVPAIDPDIWTEAVITGAKANYIDRVEYQLYSPAGAKIDETIVASDSPDLIDGRYFVWKNFDSTQWDDDKGYLVRAEAFDDLGHSDVDSLRFNIDNTKPANITTIDATYTSEFAKAAELSWTWTPAADDPLPDLDRFIIQRFEKGASGGYVPWSWYISVPGSESKFIDVRLVSGDKLAYEIMAVDPAGNVSAVSRKEREQDVVPTPWEGVPPDIFGSGSVEAVSWNAIELSWPQVEDNVGGSGLAGYYWYCRDEAGIWAVIASTTDTASDPAFYRDPGLKPGRTYQYTAFSYDHAGNLSSTLWPPSPYDILVTTTPMR